MRMESGLLLRPQLRPSSISTTKLLGIHKKLEYRSGSIVTCTVDRAQATQRFCSGTACIAEEQAEVLSLSAVERPERSALEDLLEHRWRSGAALYEISLQRDLAMREAEALAQLQLIQEKQGLEHQRAAETAQVPGSYGTPGGSMELAAMAQSLAPLSAHLEKPIQSGALSSDIQRRRSLRRLRRQQAATAAAVAGAVAGVEPGAVLAAAKACLAEERAFPGSAEALRGSGERLRRWKPLSPSFQQADCALERKPRVFRAAAEALQSSGQRRKPLQLLTSEEETHLALQVVKSREVQRELSAAEERLGKQLTVAEAAGHLGWADPQQLDRCMEQSRAAQQMLYHRNLGLAHKLAYMYYSCSDKAVAYPDLIQAACGGLMHAIGLFDPSRGVRLGSYATHWIRCFCSELAGLERDVIYVPYDAAKRYKELSHIKERLRRRLRRQPTLEEVTLAAGLTTKQVQRSLRAQAMRVTFMSQPRSMSARSKSTGARETWGDAVESQDESIERQVQHMELVEQLHALLGQLSERQQIALKLSYGLDGQPPLRQYEVAATLGVSHQAIHGMLRTAFKRLHSEHKPALQAMLASMP